MKGLYVHIPFCKTICSYCDFPKIIARPQQQEDYIRRLLEELELYSSQLQDISTVYIGGGTPNAIPLGLLETLLEKLSKPISGAEEVTVELNPELLTKAAVDLLKASGVNRVSLGVQSLSSAALEILNRHHSREDVVHAISMLREAGITNINVDLMFGIPGTTIGDMEADLDFVLGLNIPHLSCYSLILEEKTVLMHKINHKMLEMPSDDTVADMYELITRKLKACGYHHYEISNFAKPGYESRHNLLYWSGGEYIGVGCGACGYLQSVRTQNHRILSRYMKDFIEEREYISVQERKKEYFLLGLRKMDGVSLTEYEKQFHSNPMEDFDLNGLLRKGLIEIQGDMLRICPDKIFVANLVFEEFVGD